MTDFAKLHATFSESLKEAFDCKDIQLLKKVYDNFDVSSESNKKNPMDQAFREFLIFELSEDVEKIGTLIKMSVEAVRAEIVSVTMPVVLFGDIFDTITLEKCEKIFNYVEEMVEVWKEDIFFTSCKNNILRMCNDLLRRLSRAQNTVFCGRILLFLSKFFPFSERSGLNIVSEFNLDNVTEYGIDGKDLDDTVEEMEEIPIKIDYNLYCKFWSLQDFFRNPNQCYSRASWKMFQTHTVNVLDAFSGFKLEDNQQQLNTMFMSEEEIIDGNDVCAEKMDTDSASIDITHQKDIGESIKSGERFFAKYLTNSKLLALQLSDSNFRRAVLMQFLILFQYLQLTVKFKSESNVLTTAQSDFIKETESRVYQLLEETPPNGKRFARTAKHMLTREEMWNNWKNEGCREIKKPDETASTSSMSFNVDDKPPPAKRERKMLGDCLREANSQGKFFLGNDILTKLWNYSPDNLLSCKSEERNFLPQVDTYLEASKDKHDTSMEWRALRLLARQSPHFFSFINSTSCKISDYLEAVSKRLAKDRLDAIIQTRNNANIHLNKTTNGTSNTVNNNEMSCSVGPANNTTNGVNPLNKNISKANQNANETLNNSPMPEESNNEDGDLEDVGGDVPEEEDTDLEKNDDDTNVHSKPVTANKEQIEELAPLIGDDWKKLGKKLGYTLDELLYLESNSSDRDGGCTAMLINWFDDDDDANLDNLAYVLEGLEIYTAAKAVKALIDRIASKAALAAAHENMEIND